MTKLTLMGSLTIKFNKRKINDNDLKSTRLTRAVTDKVKA